MAEAGGNRDCETMSLAVGTTFGPAAARCAWASHRLTLNATMTRELDTDTCMGPGRSWALISARD